MAKNIDDWFIWVEANRDTPTRKWAEEVLPPAKQALYTDILELIGEDDEAPTSEYLNEYARMLGRDNSDYAQMHSAYQANRVKAYYRTKLKEYFNL